ncbi:MAG: hypothetical protein ACFFEO_10680 [Candidatus Thorarchaeota archaeon]
MEVMKSKVEVLTLTDAQIEKVYELASNVNLTVIEDVAPDLLEVCLNAQGGILKNELGRVIFHLQKTERLNTRIGFEKLLDGALRVNAKQVFKILTEAGAEELVKEIKALL